MNSVIADVPSGRRWRHFWDREGLAAVVLRVIGGTSLWALAGAKLYYLSAGGLKLWNSLTGRYYILLVAVTLVEMVLGTWYFRRAERGLVGYAVVALGLILTVASIVGVGPPTGACGCVGSLQVGIPTRLSLSALVLLLGGLRLIDNKPPKVVENDRRRWK